MERFSQISFLSVVGNILLIVNCLLISVNGHEGSSAVKYDASTFSEALGKSNHFVMFFAPWCGHCKRLAPTWEQLAEKLHSKEDNNIIIGKVDCTTETGLCSDHEVTGYPTLKFFKANSDPSEAVRYKGKRDLESLEEFLTQQFEVKDKPEPPSLDGHEGLVELTGENFKSFIEEGDHFVKFYAPWCGHCQHLAPTWDALGESMKFDPSVKIAKIDCTAHKEPCKEFEVKGYPTLLWIRDGKMVERYQGSRSHEDLKEFVMKMKQDATKKPEVDDQEDGKVPEKVETAVLPLTGENFENAVSSGVTFVKFFAPWCGHCKRLAPTWEDLAMKFLTNSGVKVATVDCTVESNRELCKNNKVEGYPTLILFKNGRKQDEYNGPRDLSSLHMFVVNHINRDEL